jgi:hypothetical protein
LESAFPVLKSLVDLLERGDSYKAGRLPANALFWCVSLY